MDSPALLMKSAQGWKVYASQSSRNNCEVQQDCNGRLSFLKIVSEYILAAHIGILATHIVRYIIQGNKFQFTIHEGSTWRTFLAGSELESLTSEVTAIFKHFPRLSQNHSAATVKPTQTRTRMGVRLRPLPRAATSCQTAHWR